METIQLHPNLPAFSRIVYGAWRLNDGDDQRATHALAKIQAALEVGITTFDHADIYGDHSCEALFGEALKLDRGLKNKIQIVTKCDIMLNSPRFLQRRIKHYDTSPAHIQHSVDTSLKLLGIEAIDVLLLHRPDPLMDAAATGSCLDQLVKAGKIRAAGVSNFLPWDWTLLQSKMTTPLVTNQIELSLLAPHALTDGTLAQAQMVNAPPMAWSPLGGGALFGEGETAKRLRPALQRLATQHNVGIDAVALAWLLAHPARIVPVVGTNNLSRLTKLADAFKVTIERETWFELLELSVGHEVA